ncbi:MAG: hypothetical protein AB7O28_04265 [Vicinamibacterales bacterium]
MRTTLLVAILAVAWAGPAMAQSAPVEKATSLAVTGGVSNTDRDTGAVFGGSARWEFTANLALEGTGRWLDRGTHPDAWAAEVAAVVGLGGRRDSVMPYLVGGLGVHRRTFHTGAGPALPEFYGRRVRASANPIADQVTFTDPTFVVGTGMELPLSRTVVVRPDVRALLVRGDGRGDTVVVATVSLGFRFEHKPVTPARRPLP